MNVVLERNAVGLNFKCEFDIVIILVDFPLNDISEDGALSLCVEKVEG